MTSDNPDAIDFDADAEKLQRKQLLTALDRDEQLQQLGLLLQSESLRDFLWRILCQCHIYNSTFNRNFGDMAHAEGMRNIGLWLLSEICEADPGAEMKMREKSIRLAAAVRLKEAQEKRRRSRDAG